jgi:hypothetical protein
MIKHDKLEYYSEPSKKVPIIYEKDVIVVGGGPAGVGAAIAASRNGMDTLLIERYAYLGGSHTVGAIGAFCGHFAQSEKPVSLARGLNHLLINKLQQENGITEPQNWQNTFLLPYDHFQLKLTLDELTEESKVDLLFHSQVVDVIMEENNLRGVVIENKSGRQAILAKRVIDCSGDADVAARSGAPFQVGELSKRQFPTLMFRMMNVDAARVRSMHASEIENKMDEVGSEFGFERKYGWIFYTPRLGEVILNMTKISINGNAIDATNVKELTVGELIGRKQVKSYATFLRKYIPGFEFSNIEATGSQVAVRESRLIDGEYQLTKEDVIQCRKFDDGIAQSAWPFEVHSGERAEVVPFNTGDGMYQIPYRCLVPKQVESLLVAGRCLSAQQAAHSSARTWAICMEEGEAAGVAVALSIEKNKKLRDINYEELTERLTKFRSSIEKY